MLGEEKNGEKFGRSIANGRWRKEGRDIWVNQRRKERIL